MRIDTSFNDMSALFANSSEDNAEVGAAETQAHRESERRQRRVRRLAKLGKDNAEASLLCAKISACERAHRCGSGACPHCSGAAKRLFTRSAMDFAERTEKAQQYRFFVTITASSRDSLRGFDADELNFALKGALASKSMLDAIFAMSFHFHEHESGGYDPFYAAHFDGLIASDEHAASISANLRGSYSATDLIPQPVCVVPWDGSVASCARLFQTSCRRYIDLDEEMVWSEEDGEPHIIRRGHWGQLPSWGRLDAWMLLDRIPLDQRACCKGPKFETDMNTIDLAYHQP